MTTSASKKLLPLAEQISHNLAFRQSADDLFDYIDALEESKIIIDFSNITFMSSSFAHQYILNRKSSKKDITENNVTKQAMQMFELVERRRSKARVSNKSPDIVEAAY